MFVHPDFDLSAPQGRLLLVLSRLSDFKPPGSFGHYESPHMPEFDFIAHIDRFFRLFARCGRR